MTRMKVRDSYSNRKKFDDWTEAVQFAQQGVKGADITPQPHTIRKRIRRMTKVQKEVLDAIESRPMFARWCNSAQRAMPVSGTFWAAFYEGGDLHVAVVTPILGLIREEVARG